MWWFAAIAVLIFAVSPVHADDGGTARIIETPQVSQPAPFSKGGKTVIVPRTHIEIDEGARKPAPQTLIGKPRIIDGDTIEIAGQRIRLHGIDAPETDQTCRRRDSSEYSCGEMATFNLAEIIETHWVHCEGKERDRYGRLVAICYTGPHNIGAEMVRRGWALAYRKYSTDYVDEEQDAQSKGRGIFAGTFEPPWEWRRK